MGLLEMSLTASILVVVVTLIRAVGLNRLPKTLFVALWGTVIFRLLVPVAIPVPFDPIFAVRELVGTPNVSRATAAVLTTAEPTLTSTPPVLPIVQTPAIPVNGAVYGQTLGVFPITLVWLVGALITLVFFAVIYYRSHRELRFATQIRDNAHLNEWLSEHRLLRPIAIMQSDRVTAPLAVGILRPRIILPLSMSLENTRLLRHVLLHEYYHIKRFDALWKILMIVALCIHWFNPLVWLVPVLANRDLELSCDELVLRRFGLHSREGYALSIIGMAEQRGGLALLHSGFSKNATKERIESIMKTKAISFTRTALSFILVPALAVGALMVYAGGSEPENMETDLVISERNLLDRYSNVYADDMSTAVGRFSGLGDPSDGAQAYSLTAEELIEATGYIPEGTTDDSPTMAALPNGQLAWPVPQASAISSPFGPRVNPLTEREEFHTGIDLPAPAGSDIVAAHYGVVMFSDWIEGFGNTIIIDHGGGLTTLYAQNHSNAVSVGERVTRGQVIGTVGSTGYSAGPHLHFEVRVNGAPVNPVDYLR